MIFEINCSIFKNLLFLLQFSLFQNSHFWGGVFGQKNTPKLQKMFKKGQNHQFALISFTFHQQKIHFLTLTFFSDLWHGIAQLQNEEKNKYSWILTKGFNRFSRMTISCKFKSSWGPNLAELPSWNQNLPHSLKIQPAATPPSTFNDSRTPEQMKQFRYF